MKTYYMLTKPGIIMGNIITTAAGFALASRGNIDYGLFLATLLGLGLIIASAGVFNNYLDRAMDAKMERTSDRALVKGTISIQNALVFASVLGLIGAAILVYFTNLLTFGIAFIGFFVYLVLYAFWKYRSFYGTLVGSIAGAVPPVVGYCAVSDRLDMGAFLLFMILLLWQMPHFFAIAIYRLKDYADASIPVLPIEKGIFATKIQMLLYIVTFMLTTLLLTVMGYTGDVYFVVAIVLGIAWLGLCLNGFFKEKEMDAIWAKQMFVCSLAIIMTLCLTMAVDYT